MISKAFWTFPKPTGFSPAETLANSINRLSHQPVFASCQSFHFTPPLIARFPGAPLFLSFQYVKKALFFPLIPPPFLPSPPHVTLLFDCFHFSWNFYLDGFTPIAVSPISFTPLLFDKQPVLNIFIQTPPRFETFTQFLSFSLSLAWPNYSAIILHLPNEKPFYSPSQLVGFEDYPPEPTFNPSSPPPPSPSFDWVPFTPQPQFFFAGPSTIFLPPRFHICTSPFYFQLFLFKVTGFPKNTPPQPIRDWFMVSAPSSFHSLSTQVYSPQGTFFVGLQLVLPFFCTTSAFSRVFSAPRFLVFGTPPGSFPPHVSHTIKPPPPPGTMGVFA